MNDNEIIKAWKCCSAPSCNCKECPMAGVNGCYVALKYETLDLINRQKAEIERLQKTVVDLNSNLSESINCFTRMESLYKIKCKELEVAKSEAYKELAEKLYEKIEQNSQFGFAYVTKKEIENVVRELEGEE